MWTENSIFYHIYPLGFCGAQEHNNFCAEPQNRIAKVGEWVEHIKSLGANALYIGPLFESTAHGYDTADYYHIDRRLGTNEDFKVVAQKLHQNGIKIVLDGVFNHVGRDFWAFRDVKEHKGYSKYCDWFSIKWDCNNSYNDGFAYQDWEGCGDLVKLNLQNDEVKQHIFQAVESWVRDYDIDGLRLDVAYCLDKDFLKELRTHCKALKSDFWLMGETLHGDYNQWMNDEMLDSVTNYECYKGLYSSCNCKNMFEIAHSLKRQDALYNGKKMYTFVDNHDVSRVSTVLEDKRHLKPLYTLMFAMPGIPSVYYGSEWAAEGDKKCGDGVLRPDFDSAAENDLTAHIKRLSRLRQENSVFADGTYEQIHLTNEAYVFARKNSHQTALCAVNIGEEKLVFDYDCRTVTVEPCSSEILLNTF